MSVTSLIHPPSVSHLIPLWAWLPNLICLIASQYEEHDHSVHAHSVVAVLVRCYCCTKSVCVIGYNICIKPVIFLTCLQLIV